MNPRESLIRWRLVLGRDAEQGLGCGLDGDDARRDGALGYLYNREYGSGRNVRTGRGSGRRYARSVGADRARMDQRRPRAVSQTHHRTHREGRPGALPAAGDGDEPRSARPRPAEPDAAQGGAAHQAPDESRSAGPGPRSGAQGRRATHGEAGPAGAVAVPRCRRSPAPLDDAASPRTSTPAPPSAAIWPITIRRRKRLFIQTRLLLFARPAAGRSLADHHRRG